MTCSTAIQKLYGELAASLVCATTSFCEPHARAGASIRGPLVSAFRGAYSMLGTLRLASSGDVLLVDSDKVLCFVTELFQSGQFECPPINDVIDAWLSLLAAQLDYASLKRLPFIPHQDIRPVMNALAACGYAERIDNTFIWTDKIGCAMQMSGWWNEDGLSREELEEREVDLDMRKALASIPNDVRYSALRDNSVAVSKALAARWIDGVWLPDTVDEAPWWRLAALAPEAKRLVELVQGNNYPQTDVVN